MKHEIEENLSEERNFVIRSGFGSSGTYVRRIRELGSWTRDINNARLFPTASAAGQYMSKAGHVSSDIVEVSVKLKTITEVSIIGVI